MGFFGIGTGEILIILVIALILVGPHKLPELAKMLGKGFSEFKKAADDLRNSVSAEIQVEEEKRKLLEIRPQREENGPVGPVETDNTKTHNTESVDERGNAARDEEKKDLL